MNKSGTILMLFILLILLIFINKVDLKQDLTWNLKNTFHPKIIFQLKKVYIVYFDQQGDWKTFYTENLEIPE